MLILVRRSGEGGLGGNLKKISLKSLPQRGAARERDEEEEDDEVRVLMRVLRKIARKPAWSS